MHLNHKFIPVLFHINVFLGRVKDISSRRYSRSMQGIMSLWITPYTIYLETPPLSHGPSWTNWKRRLVLWQDLSWDALVGPSFNVI